ncbi:enoyl-CoA hydratase-related protein [Rhodococcus sp. W8901]|uniref:enoyl-CoA hydratase-related protein n=1 Tax=Rhodococcus sp. W8901 TaxID=2742603 RepID=UPI001583E5DC|nr:enoyl-CoA hydratase-related protein [Rhodococcus sp. W8901]QKT09426.1 hypothetical protein HUN07_00555 [Rhodococcus sp. W8901]
MSTIGSGVLTSLDGGILRITIDCAASMNAVLTETLDAIAEAFETYSMDPDVRVAVLTGAGRSFSTGGSEPAGSSCSARETSPSQRVPRQATAELRQPLIRNRHQGQRVTAPLVDLDADSAGQIYQRGCLFSSSPPRVAR